jgi:hypothetical protein
MHIVYRLTQSLEFNYKLDPHPADMTNEFITCKARWLMVKGRPFASDWAI